MKKTPKQIAAIVALVAIVVMIIAFVIASFTTTAESKNLFYALFCCIIAVPILAWLFILCMGRMKGEHTIAEFFPKNSASTDMVLPPNPDAEKQDFSEEEITQAMEESATQK